MAIPNIIDEQGRVTVGAGTAVRWTVVLSGITVSPARADCTFLTLFTCRSACQDSHTYAPGGTPLGGTFEVTKDAWDELDALVPGFLPLPNTGYDLPDCRWAYFENPGTTMVGGIPLATDPHDLSDADPPTIVAILFYRYAEEFVCKVYNLFTGVAGSGESTDVFDSFGDEAGGNPDCDRNAITVTNNFTSCFSGRVGKLGTATATRCT